MKKDEKVTNLATLRMVDPLKGEQSALDAIEKLESEHLEVPILNLKIHSKEKSIEVNTGTTLFKS
jgi:hypothetical protein